MKRTIVMRIQAGICGLALLGTVQAAELSEQDYYDELPTVLTVSRLAQPLNETPGAVTVINRETIRRSGARELVDVLRLVPGYLVGGFNGANPSASYHAPLDDYGIRNLVLIDGRPVYSAYYFGGTSRGMMGVLLEDIERIEVLRGSNSAAYGANALFGVINIITRNAADTQGTEVSVTGGNGGIKDNTVRHGWGNDSASFRLSTGRRSDTGYGNSHDDKIMSQLNFRGDLRPTRDQEVMIAAGAAQLAAGDGFAGKAGNAERTVGWNNFFLQGQWKRQVSETEEIKVSASFNQEDLQDGFTYAPDPGVVVSSSGRGRRLNLEFQHQLMLTPQVRAVWGAGYKYEDAMSRPLYNTDNAVAIHEERLFGNVEWRFHPQWLLNAGGFAGHHSQTGQYFSPRLMANFLVTPDHVLRLGATESTRSPTLFELASDARLYPKAAANLLAAGELIPSLIATANQLNPAQPYPYRLFFSSGQVSSEKLWVQELGYFGNFRALKLTLDARVYVETLHDLISKEFDTVPGYVVPPLPGPLGIYSGTPIPTQVFLNTPGFKTRGLEYQLRWKPLDKTEIWINQSLQRTIWDDDADRPYAPTHATAIAWFQRLPYDFDLSVIHQSTGSMSWGKQAEALPRQRRLDLRLAKLFRVGRTRAEAAITVQALNGSMPAYQAGTSHIFERRAFGTLRIEF